MGDLNFRINLLVPNINVGKFSILASNCIWVASEV